MSLPSSVGLPQEMMLGHLDYSLPPDAKSMSVKVLPSNLSQVQTTLTVPAGTGIAADQSFPSTNLIFDIPCGASPSMFIDNRFTTLNFQVNIACTTAGLATGVFNNSYLRSGAYSFFDRMYITSQNGQINL